MTQAVVQSTNVAFAGSSPRTLTLNGVQAGNCIEIRATNYEGGSQVANMTVSDGTNTYQLAARVRTYPTYAGGSNVVAEIHYAENVPAGNYTITVTSSAASGNKYGWVWAGEISGRATSGSLDTAATGTLVGSSNSPSVTGAGSSTQANALVVGVMSVDGSGTNVGIDAASGSSLTWTNRLLKQDTNAEMAGSFDDAPATSTLTPSVAWGTLDASRKWAAVIAVFKDASSGPVEEDITEAAEADASFDAVARAVGEVTEGAEAGDDYLGSIGVEVSEGAAAGASFVAVARAVVSVDEDAETGDSYTATGGAVPVRPRGGRTRIERRPEELPPALIGIYWLQPRQEFVAHLSVSGAMSLEMEQARAESVAHLAVGDTVTLEVRQAAQELIARMMAPPMVGPPVAVKAKHQTARVEVRFEQPAAEIELA